MVIREAKGEGVGRGLVQIALLRLKKDGVKRAYLLTADTAQYFGYLGFEKVQPHQVDAAVMRSPEVVAYDPDDVTYMCRQIDD